MTLVLDNVGVGYAGKAVLAEITLTVGAGVTCLLGPNGAGKTTLFKSMLGLLPTTTGRIALFGRQLPDWSRRELAQVMGYVPQAHAAMFPFTVLDMVVMGRSAHLPPYAVPSRTDTDLARQSLDRLQLLGLSSRAYTELSGGERQLVLVARALAQQPKILIMDEPTASLDYGNQMRVLDHVAALAESGMAVVLSTHHPEHALRVGDDVALVARGRLHAFGTPRDVLTPDTIRAVYGVDTVIGTLPGARTPSIAQTAKEINHGA